MTTLNYLRDKKYLEEKNKYFTWQSPELERTGEVQESVAGVEDVGALRGRGTDLSLVSAPPGGAQLGAVLQGQAGVTVVHYQHGGPEGREMG